MNNPYRTPNANTSSRDSSQTINHFPNQSTGLIAFLTLITLGVYSIYWLYSRTLTINQYHKSHIHPVLVGSFLLFYGFFMPYSFFVDIKFTDMDDTLLNGGLILIIITLFYWWVFTLRAKLIEIQKQLSIEPPSINLVFTLFFHVIYFQYKINTIKALSSND